MTGFAVAIALLGCALGAWFAGRLADVWGGRKRVMLLGSALFTISAIGTAYTQTIPDLLLWRVLGGIGIGIASVIAPPAYISEIAPARYRGALASMQQLAITMGIFAALLSDAVLADTAGSASNDLWWGSGGLAMDVPRGCRTRPRLRRPRSDDPPSHRDIWWAATAMRKQPAFSRR